MLHNEINKISSLKSRNVVRGIISSPDEVLTTDNFDRNYLNFGDEDLQIAESIISSFQVEDKVRISLPFPPKPPSIFSLDNKNKSSNSGYLSYLGKRISKYREKLIKYIIYTSALNNAVLKLDIEDVRQSLQSIKNDYGYSIHVARKVASLKFIFENNNEMSNALNLYYENIKYKRQVFYRSLEDMFDFSQRYLTTRRNYLKITKGDRLHLISRQLIDHHFSPVPSTEEVWIQRLRACAAYSLPDAVMYLLESQIIGTAFEEHEDNLSKLNLPSALKAEFENTKTSGILRTFDEASETSRLSALEIFRCSRAWICDDEISSFYLPIEHYLGARMDGDFAQFRSPVFSEYVQSNQIEKYFSRIVHENRVIEIDPSLEKLLEDSGLQYRSGTLQRTLLLIQHVEKGKNFSKYDGSELLNLLNHTQEISELLSEAELDGAFPPKPSDLLYEMLRSTLKFDANPGVATDFNMRSSTENLVISQFGGDILALLKFIHERAPVVSDFYITMWTQHFLVQCYKLYESAYDVNEARRSLLEWYGLATDNQVLIERARSLGLENKLARIRHDIDSQRLYVDLVRFKQWMLDKLADTLRDIADSSIHQESPDEKIDFTDEIEVIINPEYSLANVVNAAFNEFCCNKAYGVDSYIGRRIRHGTFHGTLHKSASDMVEDILFQLGPERDLFEPGLRAWLFHFDSEVKRFPQERLQIRSEKKPRGLLNPNINEASQLRTLGFAVLQIRECLVDREAIDEAVDLISQACWLLLQPNLTVIQREIERWRSESLILKREAFGKQGDAVFEENARAIVRRVNEKVSDVLQQISSWFAAPKETTPSASLLELFHVVRSEVAEQVPGFLPKVVEPEKSSIRIVGHRYQYVYDALYIIVHNAACHGRKGGKLELRLNERIEAEKSIIDVVISSEFPDDAEDSIAKIKKAMHAPMDDALVTEGSTGIRKLRALATPKAEIDNVKVQFTDHRVDFSFQLILAVI